MAEEPQRPPAARKGLVAQELDGELMIYDPESQTFHALSPIAASTFQACDGMTSAEEITALVASKHGLPPASAHDATLLAVEDLTRARLLEPPTTEVDRRGAVRRLVSASLAGLLVPGVISVLAPDPAAAGSGVPIGSNTQRYYPMLEVEGVGATPAASLDSFITRADSAAYMYADRTMGGFLGGYSTDNRPPVQVGSAWRTIGWVTSVIVVAPGHH